MLGLLAEGPLHGYDLKLAYEQELVPTARLNFGQVYSTLDRLCRDGLAEFEQVNQTERPDKKVYRLTETGRRELTAWLASPDPPGLEERNGTFLKLTLARRLQAYDPLSCLNSERDACFARLQEVMQAKAQAEKEGASYQTTLLLELAILRLEAFLKWLDRCEQVFAKDNRRD